MYVGQSHDTLIPQRKLPPSSDASRRDIGVTGETSKPGAGQGTRISASHAVNTRLYVTHASLYLPFSYLAPQPIIQIYQSTRSPPTALPEPTSIMPNPLPDPITMTHDAICLATHMFLGWAFGVRWNSISRWFWVGSVKLLTAALMLYVLRRTFRALKRKIPSTIFAARKAAAYYCPYLLGWLAPPMEDTDIPGVVYMCQREKRLVLKVNGWDEVYLDQVMKMPVSIEICPTFVSFYRYRPPSQPP